MASTPTTTALVIVAAHTGLRFQELAALRWHDLDLRHPLDDGVITGPGRLRVSRVLADPAAAAPGATTALPASPPTAPSPSTTPGPATADCTSMIMPIFALCRPWQ